MALQFDIITLFPDMFAALEQGVIGRAQTEQQLRLRFTNPRDFTQDSHRTVDDRPYGGGPGMVMLYAPLAKAIHAIKQDMAQPGPVIYLSPQGRPFTQLDAHRLSQLPQATLLCGRYEGVDQRLIDDHVDECISLGDFVVSGGELPAMMLIDATTRLLPGVLGSAESAQNDSFQAGLLEGPSYTRPEEINGKSVPKVLLSGDHQAIAQWRHQQSLGKTWQMRPNLIKRRSLDENDAALLDEFITSQALRNEDQKHD